MTRIDHIQNLFVGAAGTLPDGTESALNKQPINGPLALDSLGLRGDTQVDLTNHGGPERAVLHYCERHYADWTRELPQLAALLKPAGFGENLSSAAMNEDNVCIGDIYQLGTARVQVAQPRTPCRKLNERFGIPDLVQRVLASQRCGWFYRVLEPGQLSIGDAIELLDRPHHDLTVSKVMRALSVTSNDTTLLTVLAALPELSPRWRTKAEQRLGTAPMT